MTRRRLAVALAGLAAFFVLLLFLLLSPGERQSTTRTLVAMDTVMSFTACGPDREAALDEALAEVQRLDALLDAQDPASEISRLNAAGSASLSEDTAALLQAALEAYRDTDGLFDCTIYPLMELWGFSTGAYHVPSEAELAERLLLVDSGQISLRGTAAALGPGQRIDLGGIAKGYASARVMAIFQKHGLRSGMVSLGGNVQTLGERPQGGAWQIGLRDPAGSEADYLAVVKVEGQAVVTSGGYERYFEQDGKTYIHILDPRTGRPATGDLLSATVVSPDGTLADALSTAVFLMGRDAALDYWRTREGFDLALLTTDGSLYVTEGIAALVQSERDIFVVRRGKER